MQKAKPFIKWVGGKGQLIKQLEALLPSDFATRDNLTYIEPFVGGGAMLFYMLQTYPNIKSAVINDINPDLTLCYRVVRDNPTELVKNLKIIQKEYYSLPTQELKKEYFLKQRECFNSKSLNEIDNSSLFIFLNRTCFNGLYRVNKAGLFNVPFGSYLTPMICDSETIFADSKLLENVDILTGDFEDTFNKIKNNTFFYFDPPYRPLSNTSNFKDYSKEGFNDDSQRRLKLFCDRINSIGVNFILSNSDCFATEQRDCFFDELFSEYRIERVLASRNINSVGSKRGKLTEIVVRNYELNEVLQIIKVAENEYVYGK